LNERKKVEKGEEKVVPSLTSLNNLLDCSWNGNGVEMSPVTEQERVEGEGG
jgi:hypothetical protein